MRNGIGLFVFALVAGAAAHAQSLAAPGGAGDSGGAGGEVVVRASDAVVAGAGAKAKAPKAPKVSTKAELIASDTDGDLTLEIEDLDASPADLDPDDFEVTVRGDVLVPAGATLNVEDDSTIRSTQGGVFIVGNVADNGGGIDGVSLDLISLRKAVVVQGNVDLDGETASFGGDGGDLDLFGAQVAITGASTVSARGGASTGGGNDGGGGGSVDIGPSDPVIHGRVSAQVGADATVDLRGGQSGTGGGADGGDGGDFDVNYSDLLGTASTLTLAGRIDVRGGAAQAGAGSGGDAGSIQADVGGALAVTGELDASGGAGAAGADGGSGGDIELGGRAVGKAPISILVPGSTDVDVNVGGGAGADGQGGAGGLILVEADLRGVRWTGDLSAAGGSSIDDDGADGGEVSLMSWGPRGAPVIVDGSIAAQGSDANGDGDGSAGGDISLVSLDGPVELSGSANTSAGDAAGDGNDADAAGAGDLFLLADDTNGLPGTGVNDDAIDLLDDLGGTIRVGGNLTASGGNGGASGATDGSDGGMITVDADGDDGEEPGNGTVELADGVAIDASGGNGNGGGTSGDGGDITVRGSNGNEDGAVSGVIQGVGNTFTSDGGVGGTAGAAGTIVID
jgi:hypothetical protein